MVNKIKSHIMSDNTKHINLLLDINELDWVFRDSSSIENFLENIVRMVASHMVADVCSIYIMDEQSNELVLKANVGLNREFIGGLRLKAGEGIAGSSFQQGKPIITGDGFSHPNFKFFKGTNEELFKSFLAVPIVRGASKIGVLMLQRKEENHFEDVDVLALKVIASQLANVIENIQLITSVQPRPPVSGSGRAAEPITDRFVKGKPASRGYAYGDVRILGQGSAFKEFETLTFQKRYGAGDLLKAVGETKKQLEEMQTNVETKLSDAASMIFTSHLLILKDKGFMDPINSIIAGGGNAPEAVIAIANKYIELFRQSPNTYIREKTKDIEDLAARILSNLLGGPAGAQGLAGRIVVAREMYPSEILRLSSENAGGIVLTSGGVTSHVAILANSLEIPMVIANDKRLLDLPPSTKILLDSESGNIYISPANDILSEFADKISAKTLPKPKPFMLPNTQTKDGTRIKLLANVNLLKDLEAVRDLACDGVGLYRSEFPFIIRKDFPTEEEQYFVYRKLVEGMGGKEVTFRTLDIGGDKMLSYYPFSKNDNPFLGMRSIRFSLKNKDIFTQQIRAILRASHGFPIGIMFPMVFSIEEFIQAKDIVTECIEGLKSSGVAHNPAPKLGIMVEVPAVISIIDDFAKIADFFSIGTNDLVQYMLAVDRTNEDVADYYIPHHPAVLKAIKQVSAAAARAGKEVSVCGDMSNSPLYVPFLVGCGIKALSMKPSNLPEIQALLAKLNINDCRKLAESVLATPDIGKILKELESVPLKLYNN
jgi:phosphotransferase system enzyme I (PtsP)